MQKDIKFRVWNDKYKKFVFNLDFGQIQAANCNNGLLGVTFSNSELKTDEIKYKDCTVQQFTGLFDKNGKEIYEGDIVKYTVIPDYYPSDKPYETITKVELKLSTNLDTEHGGGPDGTTRYENIEVIGNVFENPELVK
jgi:uncharacterized phage protein (TIGR01671 family)